AACASSRIEQLYPVVGMESANSWVDANFGNRPFKFDIKLYTETFKSQDGFLML
ncbi:16184_t:CDS:2, partial [Racocetra persica]